MLINWNNGIIEDVEDSVPTLAEIYQKYQEYKIAERKELDEEREIAYQELMQWKYDR